MSISLEKTSEAYNKLKEYNGENSYLINLKNDVFVYKNKTLNELQIEYILENPKDKVTQEDVQINEDREIYFRENICNIFEIHYSQENAEKYKHIIENVKKYVEKMMED